MSNSFSVDKDQGSTKRFGRFLSKEGYTILATAGVCNPIRIFLSLLGPSTNGAIVFKDLIAKLKGSKP